MIPNEYPEAVNRKTDSLMTNRKSTKKRENNDLPNIKKETKDRATRTPLKTVG